MADRQTDRQPYTHWKSAIFDISGNWQQLEKLPDFVKMVYKQQEICPTTERPHYQIHVQCHRQVRLTQLSEWIKHTKWFGMKGKLEIDNSIKYCAKQESAVPGTYAAVSNDNYLSVQQIMELLADEVSPTIPLFFPDEWTQDQSLVFDELTRQRGFDFLTNKLIMKNPGIVNKLTNPTLPRMWERWGESFIKLSRAKTEPTSLSSVP